MKLAVFLTLLFAGTAFASDWKAADTYRQIALTALLAVDCGQTLNASNANPPNVYQGNNTYAAGTVYRESNPLLGTHPNREAVVGYFAGAALVSAAIAYVLPEKWRHGFQYGVIGLEGFVVAGNYAVGARVAF